MGKAATQTEARKGKRKTEVVNEIVRGWIKYFRIGMMKQFIEEFGEGVRHKIRVIVMKQWKKAKTIYRNLSYLNWKYKIGCNQEEIYKVANSRLGWYRRCEMSVVNFIISKDFLENRIKDGAGLLNPSYYLLKLEYKLQSRIRHSYVRFNGRGEKTLFSLYPIGILKNNAALSCEYGVYSGKFLRNSPGEVPMNFRN